ncbi:MAG TPA: peptidase M61, partial [Allosphingosinicella sp.]
MRKTLLISLALLSTSALAELPAGKPQALSFPETIPAARDITYPGTLRLEVDATDTSRGIYRVRETIPVAGPGPITLLYPEWLPGNHGPRGPIATLAGLKVSANGQPVAWRRDPADVYAFHIDVPAGVTQLDLEFQHLSPTQPNQGRITMTPDMLNLQWEKMSLYPAGYYVRN